MKLILFAVSIILILLISGCIQSSQQINKKIIEKNIDYYCPHRSITDKPVKEPLLCLKNNNTSLFNAIMEDWFVKPSNESELVFQYRLYNYGKVEGKYISVNCVLLDNSGYNRLNFYDSNYNISPNTSIFVEFAAEKPEDYSDTKLYYSYCQAGACLGPDCDLIIKNIPSLIERQMLAKS